MWKRYQGNGQKEEGAKRKESQRAEPGVDSHSLPPLHPLLVVAGERVQSTSICSDNRMSGQPFSAAAVSSELMLLKAQPARGSSK